MDDETDVDFAVPGPSYERPEPKKNLYTPRLVGALDKCKITGRKAMHVISATICALNLNAEEYILSRSSLNEYRSLHRREIANECLRDIEVIQIIFMTLPIQI